MGQRVIGEWPVYPTVEVLNSLADSSKMKILIGKSKVWLVSEHLNSARGKKKMEQEGHSRQNTKKARHMLAWQELLTTTPQTNAYCV